jgi:quercetin dioxygenase-like cupin family protein
VQAAGAVQDLEAGDTVVIATGEGHWHGAVPGSTGPQIAVNVNVNAATIWLEPVSDEAYGAPAA